MNIPAFQFRSLQRQSSESSSLQRPFFTRSRFWLASTALLSASAAGAVEHAGIVDSWHAIPDQELAEMRGGLDLGSLIANFAIERLVRINGEVVARTQLVLSELGNLSSGGLPSVELAGNIASLIQVGQNNAVLLPAETAQAAAAQAGSAAQASAADSAIAQSAAAAAQAQAAAQQATAPVSPSSGTDGASTAASQGGAGSVATVNVASGAGGLFGPGLAMAVAAANGDLPGQAESDAANAAAAGMVPAASGIAGAASRGSSPSRPAAGAASSAAPIVGSSSTPGAASTAGAAPQQPAVQTLGTITVPVGNTGRSIVISNLPSAAALTTTIQNSVEAVRIDTETSISATMSSLAALRSSNFAAMLQQQAIDSVRR